MPRISSFYGITILMFSATMTLRTSMPDTRVAVPRLTLMETCSTDLCQPELSGLFENGRAYTVTSWRRAGNEPSEMNRQVPLSPSGR